MSNLREVVIPDMGNVSSAEVIEIAVKKGDKVKAEDTLITLESDKASMDIPSPFLGTVNDIKVKVGDKVSKGDVIITLKSDAEVEDKKSAVSAPAKAEKSVTPEKPVQKKLAEIPQEEFVSDEGDVHAGPGVRRLARDLGVNLSRIQGTGPKNRVLMEDVHAFVKGALSTPQGGMGLPSAPVIDFTQFGEIEMKPLTRIKKLTGVNLSRNWLLVPHVTQCDEADITELEVFRKEQAKKTEKEGYKLTSIVFLMKAVVASLKKYPSFNSSLDANGENLILKKYFHIGVAVDTPEGLVVPVIRNVDQKGLFDLAKELSEVSQRARSKSLHPSEMQGSCFTISSLGGIGGTSFTPIVNLPDVAILGVSKAVVKPVYQDDEFIPRLMLPLSLSYDHRVIDGAEGARFIVYLSSLLSDIRQLLL